MPFSGYNRFGYSRRHLFPNQDWGDIFPVIYVNKMHAVLFAEFHFQLIALYLRLMILSTAKIIDGFEVLNALILDCNLEATDVNVIRHGTFARTEVVGAELVYDLVITI